MQTQHSSSDYEEDLHIKRRNLYAQKQIDLRNLQQNEMKALSHLRIKMTKEVEQLRQDKNKAVDLLEKLVQLQDKYNNEYYAVGKQSDFSKINGKNYSESVLQKQVEQNRDVISLEEKQNILKLIQLIKEREEINRQMQDCNKKKHNLYQQISCQKEQVKKLSDDLCKRKEILENFKSKSASLLYQTIEQYYEFEIKHLDTLIQEALEQSENPNLKNQMSGSKLSNDLINEQPILLDGEDAGLQIIKSKRSRESDELVITKQVKETNKKNNNFKDQVVQTSVNVKHKNPILWPPELFTI